jgi:cytoskeletal protein CcmA (bactofilin family)|tara:strand:+ start:444 stop:893 length:450 start_codon:yes stop_codon:yes gene_type:complete
MFKRFMGHIIGKRSIPPFKAPSVLGPTLKLKGELSGGEELIIQAAVEGLIAHHTKSLTVGRFGRVKANIHANVIIIEGTVEGDLTGDEEIIIKNTGKVTGNLFAPRIMVEHGATFNGRIEMKLKDISSSDLTKKTSERSIGADVMVVSE